MKKISPEFDAKALQLREIRDATDAICPNFSPRALAPGNGGALTGVVLLPACYYWLALPLWLTLCIAITGGVVVRTAMRRFGKKPEDGTPRLESLLLAYDPVDKYAYRSLQNYVAESGFAVRRLRAWMDSECDALFTTHGNHIRGGSVVLEQHETANLETTARQLKRLDRTTLIMSMGVNSPMLRAMACGLPVLAGIVILARYDVAPGREWWLLPQILCLLTMALYGLLGKRYTLLHSRVREQVQAYQPADKQGHQQLLACTAIHGVQVRDVRDWIFHETRALNKLLKPDGAPDSQFVQKQVE